MRKRTHTTSKCLHLQSSPPTPKVSKEYLMWWFALFWLIQDMCFPQMGMPSRQVKWRAFNMYSSDFWQSLSRILYSGSICITSNGICLLATWIEIVTREMTRHNVSHGMKQMAHVMPISMQPLYLRNACATSLIWSTLSSVSLLISIVAALGVEMVKTARISQ